MALAPAKLRSMGDDDLVKEEGQLREEIWKLRLQLTTGQLQDPQKVRRARRDLARVLTVRRERERTATAAKTRVTESMMTEARASEAVKRRGATKLGVVTSDKMQKSVVVRVDRTVLHSKYKRYVKRSAQYMAHDEADECRIGDTVEIAESRPLSNRKRWRVRRVVRRGEASRNPEAAKA